MRGPAGARKREPPGPGYCAGKRPCGDAQGKQGGPARLRDSVKKGVRSSGGDPTGGGQAGGSPRVTGGQETRSGPTGGRVTDSPLREVVEAGMPLLRGRAHPAGQDLPLPNHRTMPMSPRERLTNLL